MQQPVGVYNLGRDTITLRGFNNESYYSFLWRPCKLTDERPPRLIYCSSPSAPDVPRLAEQRNDDRHGRLGLVQHGPHREAVGPRHDGAEEYFAWPPQGWHRNACTVAPYGTYCVCFCCLVRVRSRSVLLFWVCTLLRVRSNACFLENVGALRVVLHPGRATATNTTRHCRRQKVPGDAVWPANKTHTCSLQIHCFLSDLRRSKNPGIEPRLRSIQSPPPCHAPPHPRAPTVNQSIPSHVPLLATHPITRYCRSFDRVSDIWRTVQTIA